MAELRGLGSLHAALAAQNGSLVAIFRGSADDAREVRQDQALDFPVLADGDASVIRAYGLIHPGGGPGGEDIALPAHVLVDRSGKIVRRFVSPRIQERAKPEDDLAALRSLAP